MADPAEVLVVCNDDAAELLVRIATAAGHGARAVDLARTEGSVDAGGVLLGAVTSAVTEAGAAALIVDVGTDAAPLIGGLRSHADPAVSAVRVLVLGDGPANGRLAWQAGADGLLIRPFHVDRLRGELAAVLGRPEAERAGRRELGLSELADA